MILRLMPNQIAVLGTSNSAGNSLSGISMYTKKPGLEAPAVIFKEFSFADGRTEPLRMRVQSSLSMLHSRQKTNPRLKLIAR
jgi:hypothetical protein